jgi:hypothetical protein
MFLKLPPARVWFDVAFKLFDFFTNSPASGIKVVCPPTLLVQHCGQSKQTVFLFAGIPATTFHSGCRRTVQWSSLFESSPFGFSGVPRKFTLSLQFTISRKQGLWWNLAYTTFLLFDIELILCTRKRKPKHCFLVTEEVRLCKSFSVVWMSSAIDFGVTVGVCANSPALLAILAFSPCTEFSAKRMVKTNYRFFLIWVACAMSRRVRAVDVR